MSSKIGLLLCLGGALSAWGCTYNFPCTYGPEKNFSVLKGARAPSAPLATPMNRGQALKQECCFPDVLCGGGDKSANLLCQLYGHVIPRTRCLNKHRIIKVL